MSVFGLRRKVRRGLEFASFNGFRLLHTFQQFCNKFFFLASVGFSAFSVGPPSSYPFHFSDTPAAAKSGLWRSTSNKSPAARRESKRRSKESSHLSIVIKLFIAFQAHRNRLFRLETAKSAPWHNLRSTTPASGEGANGKYRFCAVKAGVGLKNYERQFPAVWRRSKFKMFVYRVERIQRRHIGRACAIPAAGKTRRNPPPTRPPKMNFKTETAWPI